MFYPGSKQKVKTFDNPAKNTQPVQDDRELDLGRGQTFLVNSQPREFYKISALATALNRKPVTIRKWEAEGIIPKAPFILPSSDQRGQRRLYSLEQIMGLREIARQEGVLQPSAHGKWKDITSSQFTAKAIELFKTLEGK